MSIVEVPVLETVLELPPAFETVLEVGQGVSGPPGPAGPPGGSATQYTASAALSGHTVIAIDSDGEAFYASSDQLSHALRVAGVSIGAAVLGEPITVVSAGLIVHGGWSWTPGSPVFVGLNGALTQSLPVGAVFSRVIGQAVSATGLLVDLQPPIVIAT